MNSKVLTNRTKKPRGFNKKLVASRAIIAAPFIVLLILSSYNFGFLQIKQLEDPVQTDPPPIIIKSGSFIIESLEELKDSPGTDGSIVYTPKTNFIFNRVRVFKYNDLTGRGYDPIVFKDLDVKIWFQYQDAAGKWSDIKPDAKPDITVTPNSSSIQFEIKIDKKLKFKKSSHPKRKYKYEDDQDMNPKVFRFGKVQVKNGMPLSTENGDEYIIGFYNVPSRP